MKPFHPAPTGCARATKEHMPFAGHQTVATMWAKQDAAKKRDAEGCRKSQRLSKAEQYGFNPESLKVAK